MSNLRRNSLCQTYTNILLKYEDIKTKFDFPENLHEAVRPNQDHNENILKFLKLFKLYDLN